MPASKTRSKKKSIVIRIVILLLLLLSIPLTVLSVQTIQKYLTRASETSPYKIGAYYFAMWNSKDVVNAPTLNYIANTGCQNTYGRSNDPWCGVKDFYEGRTQGWSGDFSHLKPAIGYYDTGLSSTFEKHIMQAKQNGLSFFAFYYYWDDNNKKELLQNSMNAFLNARNRDDIQFYLSAHFFETQTSSFPMIAANIANKYFSKPNYMKMPDGRPIFVLGDTRNLGDTRGTLESVNNFIDELNKKSEKAIGKKPYIVGMDWGIPQGLSVDGYTCLIPDGNLNGREYQEFIDEIPQIHNTHDKPYLTCMMENFDERPRTGVVPWIPREDIRVVKNARLALFRDALVKEKQFMDSRSDPLSKMMVIYAWNEWHEGGIIEPTVKHQARYLQNIARIFNLPRGNDPCRETGDCNYRR